MNIVLVSEGARLEMGGIGLVAVPNIARTLADLGHLVTLEIFGPPIPGSEPFATHDPALAFQKNLVAITYPARGRYALSAAAVPQVWQHVARADFVMLHSLYSFAVLTGYISARGHTKKYGVWSHGVLAPFQRTVSPKRKAIYAALFANRILNDASVIFYNAIGEREEAAELHLRAPSVIIPHGIEMEDFAQLPARGAFRHNYLNGFQGPLILYLGRLNAKKGLDLLIDAMARVRETLPEARLALVGSGDPAEFTARVQQWIQEKNLTQCVIMPGLVTGRAKLEALADADVFALASYAENFSFALFEAMASRLPVVISDTLNFAPHVQLHHAGIVVPRQANAFARALVSVLENERARREMGRNGAQLAREYSWRAMGTQLERAIQAVVSNQALPGDLVLQQTRS